MAVLVETCEAQGSVFSPSSSWDDVEGNIDVKSDAGRRVVPLAGRLRQELAAHKLRTGRGEDDLAFGRTASEAFVRTTARRRALTARTAYNEKVKRRAREQGRDIEPGELLTPLTAHEAGTPAPATSSPPT